MFENMMKCEKTWDLFCKWIKYKYKSFYNLHDDFLLSIMPFFFDDYQINIQSQKTSDGYFRYMMKKDNINWYTNLFKIRKDALIQVGEKAFEILEKNNV